MKDSNYKAFTIVAIICSLLLHSIIFVFVYASSHDNSEPHNKTEEVSTMSFLPLVDEPTSSDEDVTGNIPKQQITITNDVTQNEMHLCADNDKTYMGAGFTFTPFNGEIIDAPSYYPAYKAGIRIGDVLLNTDAKIDSKGFISFNILRDHFTHVYLVRADKICFQS